MQMKMQSLFNLVQRQQRRSSRRRGC